MTSKTKCNLRDCINWHHLQCNISSHFSKTRLWFIES